MERRAEDNQGGLWVALRNVELLKRNMARFAVRPVVLAAAWKGV